MRTIALFELGTSENLSVWTYLCLLQNEDEAVLLLDIGYVLPRLTVAPLQHTKAWEYFFANQ